MSWKIDAIVVGPIQCNCYILSDETSRAAYLIDPGAESKELHQYLAKRKFEIQAVLVTHAHIDHIGGIQALQEQVTAPVYYHAGDKFLYENIRMQAQLFGVTPAQLLSTQPVVGDSTLQHGQEFVMPGGVLRVVHTPGHTPGSVCFHADGAEQFIFTGDTLFAGSIGRTDLWGGNYDQIIESIQNRLMVLPETTVVLPGHGSDSTIAEERDNNPFLQK